MLLGSLPSPAEIQVRQFQVMTALAGCIVLSLTLGFPSHDPMPPLPFSPVSIPHATRTAAETATRCIDVSSVSAACSPLSQNRKQGWSIWYGLLRFPLGRNEALLNLSDSWMSRCMCSMEMAPSSFLWLAD